MAEKAGDIFWKIGVNTDSFRAGMRKAQTGAQKLSASMKQHSRAIGMGVAALGASITASLGLAVKSFVATGDAVHKMAIRTGVSTEALSELGFAAEQSGASLESVGKGFKNQADFIEDARDGLSTATDALDKLGISLNDLEGLSPEDTFMMLGAAIADIEDPMQRAAIANDVFKRSGQELLPLFAEGEEGMRALREEAVRLGISMSQEQADAAAKLGDAWNSLKTSMQGLMIQIAGPLVDVLNELMPHITEFITKIIDWAKNNETLAKIITVVTAGFGLLMMVLGPLIVLAPGIVAAFGIIAGAIGGITVPIALAIAAIVGGLMVAFFALQPILENAKIWIKENWDSIVLTFQKAKEFLGQAMTNLTKLMGIAIKAIMLVLGGFGKGVGQAFSDVTDSSGKGSRSFLESLQDMFEIGTKLTVKIGEVIDRLAIWLDDNWDDIMDGITWVSKWIVTPLMFMLRSFAWLAEGVVGFVGMIVGAISELVSAANKLPGGMGFLMGGGVGAMAQVIGGNLMGGGTRSAPSGFTGFSGGGGGGGAGFRSSQIAGAQAVTQHININIEGALDADQIVGEIQAPLMRVMASGLKQALA